MNTLKDQLFSQLREAMFENQLTASDLSQQNGTHYTYIYNTVRNNANVTLDTAQRLIEAAGYRAQLTFVPIDTAKPLTGTMDPQGPLFTRRAPRGSKKAQAEAEVTAQPTIALNADAKVSGITPATTAAQDLDAEIDALLEGVDA